MAIRLASGRSACARGRFAGEAGQVHRIELVEFNHLGNASGGNFAAGNVLTRVNPLVHQVDRHAKHFGEQNVHVAF